ncbi:hypothetical protein O3G_MSEX013717 [Manduca sexta]|uniref:Pattern recognition serine proteinase n=1 Tax=Manduca sexta TaxID=7130 RepID=Q69BL0_MANSE|nr:pattern recognition serine proteinase precursor [Manduca sexta]KAG6463172.1 hypothetical protein O3G_MSEX013717 [Manduca sexta]
MYTDLFFIVLATVPALTSVLKEEINYCSPDEFSCGDGSCVSFSAFCDGKRDCFNGADEACTIGENALSTDTVLNRSRRQLSNCRISQWQCKDGSCINFDGKCDGIVDCPDASDETHALCRERQCQYNWFRCTYGACVDGTAPCNGVQDCADNSDELLPRCRNETEEIRGQFKCLDGRFIAAYKHCDGVADCADGSDETLRSCAGKTCLSYLFQCAYGACVDKDSDCNGIRECVDGSDEADDLCADRNTSVQPVKEGACVLPEYPEHGGYVVSGMKNAKPGMSFEFVSLNYTCNKGYGILGRNDVTCTNGWWNFTPLPKCTRFCHLKEHVSVEYKCVLSGSSQGFRTCNEYEPDGTLVQPECRKPNYYSETTFRYMSCIGAVGAWNYVAKCIPECGTVTPNGTELVLGGERAQFGELPWQAGIYTKNTRPYMQICGGALISSTVVLSAAHCFWVNDAVTPKEEYAVALGKLYRPWQPKMVVEKDQKSEIRDIHISPYFLGRTNNYQNDIAVVILETTIVYKPHIRPVCLNFDIQFEKEQLYVGSLGKVAGWGIKDEAGNPSQVLKVVKLPYVDVLQCISQSPQAFRPYITGDKICAGFANGTGLCKGDSGGGLSFPAVNRLTERYYLRGIVSTAHTSNEACNAFALTTFTNILSHEHFIKRFWTDEY